MLTREDDKSVFENFTDEDLVGLLLADNRYAFEELYNRYWAQLYATVYKRVKSREVAEELVQDFFASLWVRKHSLAIQGSFKSYVFGAIRFLVITYYKKEISRKKYEDFALPTLTGYDNSTEETILYNDRNREINRGMLHMPQKCRSVFELSRLSYKTNKEIAAVLGISEKTVENHLTKALRILRVSIKSIAVTSFLLDKFFF